MNPAPRARIVALASALPEQVVTNADLAAENPDWRYDQLFPKTGVAERRVAGAGETTLELGLRAGADLLEKTGTDPATIDTIVCCTQTADYIMPGNAALLQDRLGLPAGTRCLDISHACSGYVQGLEIIQALIASGAAQRCLLVTGDTYSKLIRSEDRSVRSLFGDGISVSLIEAETEGEHGVIAVQSGADGKNFKFFFVEDGGFRDPRTPATDSLQAPSITMNGFGVLSYFTRKVATLLPAFLQEQGVALEDVDRFVFHQASAMALSNIVRSLKLPEEKVVQAFDDTGNLTSASIGVALERAVASGEVQEGQLVLLCGFGVGLSWATALMRY